jgi:indole-3-glycerol phosphate synthase
VSGEATYLDRIVPAVRRRLSERKRRLSQDRLEAMAEPGRRASFAGAVAAPGVSLIAEIKRASPSQGPIRPDLDVAALAGEYERAGARAASVLTEEDHFYGSLDDLRTAAKSTSLPLLRKDFIVDGYQIYEARAFGASAVLLIAALLDGPDLRELAGLAEGIGLDVLLEVHDEAEMARALEIEGPIIGVNNRDLRTFTVSLEVTERLASLVPPGRLLVSESGVKDRGDVSRLAAAGVDAILVGESILRESDVRVAIGELLDSAAPVPRRRSIE